MTREAQAIPTDALILMSQAIIKETKNKERNVSMLTPQKRELIEELERRVGEDAWILLALAS